LSPLVGETFKSGAHRPSQSSPQQKNGGGEMSTFSLQIGHRQAAGLISTLQGSRVRPVNSKNARASWSAVTESAESPLWLAHRAIPPKHKAYSHPEYSDCVSVPSAQSKTLRVRFGNSPMKVPKGQSKMAQRFKAGSQAKPGQVPKGRLKEVTGKSVQSSLRDSDRIDVLPGVETPGYRRCVPPGQDSLTFRRAFPPG
jgi:hypothetical protein